MISTRVVPVVGVFLCPETKRLERDVVRNEIRERLLRDSLDPALSHFGGAGVRLFIMNIHSQFSQ